MAVPNIFATATTSIPLSQLDTNFATAITLGSTALYLGNTTTSVAGLTLTSSALNGTVGATTPSTGAFTTLSATGLITGTSSGTSTVVGSNIIYKLVSGGANAATTIHFTDGIGYNNYISGGNNSIALQPIAAGTSALQVTSTKSAFNSTLTSNTIGANVILDVYSGGSGADATIHFSDALTYNTYISSTAGKISFQPVTAGTVVGQFTSTGLAVTGTGEFSAASTNTLRITATGTPSDVNLKFKTNTVDRWNINVPNGATTLVFTDASANNILTLTQATGLSVTGALSATGQISGTNTASYQAIFSGWGPLESNSTAGAIVVGGSSQNSGRGEIHYWNNSSPAPALYIDNTRNSTDGKVVVRLKTSGTAVEAATFNIYGIGLTGATPSSGTGITFPATQSASTDANTLDDYEEGTWTPSQGVGLTVVGTFSSTGKYTKIGRLVYVSGSISGTTSVATTAGAVTFGSIPLGGAAESSVGAMTNDNRNVLGGVSVFGTTGYSATTIAATPVIYFSLTYTV